MYTILQARIMGQLAPGLGKGAEFVQGHHFALSTPVTDANIRSTHQAARILKQPSLSNASARQQAKPASGAAVLAATHRTALRGKHVHSGILFGKRLRFGWCGGQSLSRSAHEAFFVNVQLASIVQMPVWFPSTEVSLRVHCRMFLKVSSGRLHGPVHRSGPIKR